jgi:ATP-dependent DNA helicase RecG
MDREEAERLLRDLESERVERKASLSDKDRVCQAVCAYANDLPGSGQPGHVFVGASDDGSVAPLPITDALLRELADIRDTGKLQPLPTMSVERVELGEAAVAVVTVQPSLAPPVRYEGRVWIRVGPRRAVASAEEERRLSERRIAGDLPFDQRAILNAPLSELNLGFFREEYLPNAVAADVLQANQRTVEEQLASLRFATADLQHPTNGGVLVTGLDPLAWLPGAYVQFVRFEDTELTSAILDHHMISGRLDEQVSQLGQLLHVNIQTGASIGEGIKRRDRPDYPVEALRELVHNALMHRSYEGTNAPVRVNWFRDRVEVQNPGGLYGHVRCDNMDRTTDYRNPVLAGAMKTLGYVERFGVGITRARQWLADNGNPAPEFDCEPSFVQVTVRRPE